MSRSCESKQGLTHTHTNTRGHRHIQCNAGEPFSIDLYSRPHDAFTFSIAKPKNQLQLYCKRREHKIAKSRFLFARN